MLLKFEARSKAGFFKQFLYFFNWTELVCVTWRLTTNWVGHVQWEAFWTDETSPVWCYLLHCCIMFHDLTCICRSDSQLCPYMCQAFPHLSTTSNKCWCKKVWGYMPQRCGNHSATYSYSHQMILLDWVLRVSLDVCCSFSVRFSHYWFGYSWCLYFLQQLLIGL